MLLGSDIHTYTIRATYSSAQGTQVQGYATTQVLKPHLMLSFTYHWCWMEEKITFLLPLETRCIRMFVTRLGVRFAILLLRCCTSYTFFVFLCYYIHCALNSFYAHKKEKKEVCVKVQNNNVLPREIIWQKMQKNLLCSAWNIFGSLRCV